MINWKAVNFGRPAAELARELGVTVGAVHAARRRMQGPMKGERGRPVKAEPTRAVNLRISEEVMHRVEEKAAAEGVSVSEWCRAAIMLRLD